MKFNPLYFLILTVFIGAYLIRYYTYGYNFQEGQKVRLTGTLIEDPTVKDGRQKLNFGQISAYVDQFPEYSYADKLTVEGEVAKGKGSLYLKDTQIQQVSKVENVSKYFLAFRD